MKHIITALVENKPGVLARIVGLISGRGYNIETLNVGPTQDPAISKMTLVVPGDDHVLEQVTLQVGKLVDVISVTDVTGARHLDRELILVEIATDSVAQRAEVLDLATLFRAAVAGVTERSVSLQMVGSSDVVSDFMLLLKPYKILDLSRSGQIAVARGEG
ncbi:MAG: acetolactate synthase small subunit [Lentisphaerae bacterium]|jgi:acetolactate synthase-1/3 small subunit|nr:acetolactate synthase small subunit [Lentisphaerota bacterium]